MSDSLPGIALVTPSYNQGAFLEATLRSVLDQNYPRLEYVVMDGGSTDDSVSIIGQYADRLHHWQSAADAGQYDAINAGFSRTQAEIMGWINSDDLHTPWTLSVVGEIFSVFPEIEWLTTSFPLRWDVNGRAVSCVDRRGFSPASILAGDTWSRESGCLIGPIQQESTFWRRSLWDKAGGTLDIALDSAADFDLWLRFARYAEPIAVATPLAGFRRHGAQKTSAALDRYQSQARLAFDRNGGSDKGAFHQSLRRFSREHLPAALAPLAASLGLLYRAKICRRSRDNSRWELKGTWI